MGRADCDHSGGAVAEKAAGHQVRHRSVVPLDGQRAEFDGQQQADLARPPQQVVVQAGDACRSGDAAETEHRDAFDVGTEADLRRDPGIQRRDGKAGHRGREDDVHLVRGDLRLVEGAGNGRGGQLDGHLQIDIVGLGEVLELPVPLQRERKMPGIDAAVGVQPAQ